MAKNCKDLYKCGFFLSRELPARLKISIIFKSISIEMYLERCFGDSIVFICLVLAASN